MSDLQFNYDGLDLTDSEREELDQYLRDQIASGEDLSGFISSGVLNVAAFMSVPSNVSAFALYQNAASQAQGALKNMTGHGPDLDLDSFSSDFSEPDLPDDLDNDAWEAPEIPDIDIVAADGNAADQESSGLAPLSPETAKPLVDANQEQDQPSVSESVDTELPQAIHGDQDDSPEAKKAALEAELQAQRLRNGGLTDEELSQREQQGQQPTVAWTTTIAAEAVELAKKGFGLGVAATAGAAGLVAGAAAASAHAGLKAGEVLTTGGVKTGKALGRGGVAALSAGAEATRKFSSRMMDAYKASKELRTTPDAGAKVIDFTAFKEKARQQNKASVEQRLGELRSTHLQADMDRLYAHMEDVESLSTARSSVVGGVTLGALAASYAHGSDAEKQMAKALFPSHGFDVESEYLYLQDNLKQIVDGFEACKEKALGAGWTQEEVAERLGNPLADWLEEQQENISFLDNLRGIEDPAEGESPEEQAERQAALAETVRKMVEAVKEMIQSLRGPSKGASISR